MRWQGLGLDPNYRVKLISYADLHNIADHVSIASGS